MDNIRKNNLKHSDNELGLTSNHFWLLVPMIIGLTISLFSPVDILKYTIPRWLVDSVGFFIPMVKKISGEYKLSQVAQFYYAVIWIVTMPFSWLAFKTKDLTEKKESNLFVGELFAAFVLSLGTRYVFLEGLNPNDTYSKYSVLLHSRLGMGVFGILIPIIAFITLFLDLYVISKLMAFLGKSSKE